MKFTINSLDERKIKNIILYDSLSKWIEYLIYLIVLIIDKLGFLGFCLHSQRYYSHAHKRSYKQMTAKLKSLK